MMQFHAQVKTGEGVDEILEKIIEINYQAPKGDLNEDLKMSTR